MILLDRVRDWNTLRRLTPYRPEFGRRRGNCIDRFYIEQFLGAHRQCIRGTVAEFESDQYIRQFSDGRVERAEILDINEKNTRRTMTLDLAQPATVPTSAFDCIICTQTVFFIRDYDAAVESLCRMLKPGGSLLATVPGISPVVRDNLIAGSGKDWWRFTARSAGYIFGRHFGNDNVQVQTYGNVLTATAFMHGLVQEELTQDELAYRDPDFELIVAIKATKAAVGNE